jgi:hypothetical protein
MSRLGSPEVPVQRGMGFQPMNHRQDADATKPHRQDARATFIHVLGPGDPGPACGRDHRLWRSLRIGGPAADASLIRRRFSMPVCYAKI